VKYYSERLLF